MLSAGTYHSESGLAKIKTLVGVSISLALALSLSKAAIAYWDAPDGSSGYSTHRTDRDFILAHSCEFEAEGGGKSFRCCGQCSSNAPCRLYLMCLSREILSCVCISLFRDRKALTSLRMFVAMRTARQKDPTYTGVLSEASDPVAYVSAQYARLGTEGRDCRSRFCGERIANDGDRASGQEAGSAFEEWTGP